jgi:AraC family transcriptional regulator of adaptative response/methylated-DNA-[protein]-cysteine methyltransferase
MINLTRLETPLGPMVACAVEEGICLLEFSDPARPATAFKALSLLLKDNVEEGENKHFDLLRKQLKEYFEGNRIAFTVPLVYPGTPFQQKVWEELQTIPYGRTRTYKQQAIALDNLLAIRAVASANGLNRIAILIPCHRVIGSDGKLTGYAGGLWRKQRLLDLESGVKPLQFSE